MSEGFTLEQIQNGDTQSSNSKTLDELQGNAPKVRNTGQTGKTRDEIMGKSKVTFETTPHQYDQIIADAAKKDKLDPNLLRAVGDQESGLGGSALYDPKTGLSRVPGNQGHGIFQADPASGMSEADLARAARDPQFAAQQAAQMLQQNLGRYGDTRKALAAYNAGDPNSKAGQEYADAVLAKYHRLDPIKLVQNTPPPRVPEHVALAGIGTDQVLAASRGYKAASGAVNTPLQKFGAAADDARMHSANALLNALSVLQRPTTAIAGDLIGGKWSDPKQVFGDAWQATVDPSTNQKYVDALETAMVHDIGMTQHDAGMQNWNAKDLHGLGKFLADMAVETVADPLTYVPVADFFTVGSKSVGLLSKAIHSAGGIDAALKMMGPLAKSPKIIEFFDNYKKFADTTSGIVTKFGDAVHSLTNRREDLDHIGPKGPTHTAADNNGFTHTGKLARMSIENTASSHAVTRTQQNFDILKKYEDELKNLKYGDPVPVDIQRHQLMEAWKYGTDPAREEAEALLTKIGKPPTAEERKLFPKAKGYINYQGPLQDNYMTKIIPKGPNAESHFQTESGKAAYQFIKSKGKDIEAPFAKPYTKQIPPELQGISQYDLVKNRLELGNEAVRRSQIAHETANLYKQYGSKVLKTTPMGDESLPEWMAKYVPDRSGSFTLNTGVSKGLTGKTEGQLLQGISDFMKRGILGNPFPHGLVNVGAVTLMHSNPMVWGRGMRYAFGGTPPALAKRLEAMGGPTAQVGKSLSGMAKNWGLPDELKQRLEQAGGSTSYWRDSSSVPFAIPGVFDASQHFLERMESGFRASYLQHLDKTMGVLDKSDPNFLLHELNKGAITDIHIGAYAHPTKLVSFFKGLGGLYDSFRLDTVPRAAVAALKGRTGQTLGAMGRLQDNFSNQFMPGGSQLELFGPYNDFARMSFDQLGYGLSTATLGPALGGVIDKRVKEATHQVTSANDDMGWFLDYIVPGMGSLLRARPSDKELKNAGADKELREIARNFHISDDDNPAPEWVKVIMQAILGGTTKKPESRSTIRMINRARNRAEAN